MERKLICRIRFCLSVVTALLAALVLAVGITGLAQGTLKVLTVVQGVDARSLDPATDITTSSENIYMQLFDTLVARDDGMNIIPSLATGWRTIDDTTWEFDIRRGVLFHNGQELTAQDVVFSTERLLDASKGYPKTPKVTPAIESVEAVDDYTVRFHTKGVFVTFLDILDFLYVLPQSVVEELGETEFSLHPVGSGPFRLVEWERDGQLVLDAFDEYWGGRPLIDRLIFKPIPETSTRVAALLTGEADIIVNVPPHMVDQINQAEGVRVAEIGGGRVMQVGMMNQNPPLDDVRVRQALNYAVDKQAVIDLVLGGAGRFHGKIFPSEIFGYDPDLPQPYPYNPEKAKELLSDAGYGPDNPLNVSFDAPRGRYMKDAEIAEAIAYQLQDIGINVTLTTQSWAVYWPRLSGYKVEHLWFLGLGGFFDAEYIYRLYLSSMGRKFFIPPAYVDQLVADQLTIVDREERLEALQDLMAIYQDLAPWIFLWNQVDFYGVNERVLNWMPRFDEELRFVNVDVEE